MPCRLSPRINFQRFSEHMFKTFIIGLGALIVGMLVYLYSELSQLRAQAERRGEGLVLRISHPAEGLQVALTGSERRLQLPMDVPGRYVVHELLVVEVDPPQAAEQEQPASPRAEEENDAT